MQMTATPNDNWQLIASITKASINDVGGKRSADFSEFIANFWTKYTFRDGEAKGFGLGAGINHYGDKVPSSIPSGSAGAQTGYMVPAVTTIDATLSYERGNWLFQFNGRNLGDKMYVTRFGGSVLAIWANSGRSATFFARYKW